MLLLIVGVLVAIAWIKAEWDRMEAIEQDIARKENALGELRSELATLKDELAKENEAMAGASRRASAHDAGRAGSTQ